MTWRNPSFAHLHAARDVGVAAITPDATFVAGDEKYLIDNLPSIQFSWSNAAANHLIDVDLGAGFVTGVDRLWIPNHNITGDYYVYQDDNAGFSSATLRGNGSMTSGVDLNDDGLTPTTEQYLRFIVTTSGAWSLGQLMFTKTITINERLQPNWPSYLIPDVLVYPNGDSLLLGPDRRFTEYEFRDVGSVAADLTNLEALVADVSIHKPFLLDTAYEADDGGETLFVKLTEAVKATNDSSVPATHSRRKRVRLPMLEYLG